jgi:hypothetical protein
MQIQGGNHGMGSSFRPHCPYGGRQIEIHSMSVDVTESNSRALSFWCLK